MTSVLAIHVASPAGALPQSYSIESDRVCIGTAAHCEVRLPIGDAAEEHVSLEVRGDGQIYAEAIAYEPPPIIDGRAFSVAKLAPGGVLTVGQTRIRASVSAGDGRVRPAQKWKASTVFRLFAAVGLPIAFWQLASDPADDVPSPPRKAPELFGGAPPSCPQTEGERAIAYGREQLQLADGKRQRHPFCANDGVKAVGRYRLAAACFRAGADPASAAEIDRDADSLQREIQSDYRTHRVRLDHALSVHNRSMALDEVRALRDLTTGQSGEYVTWLANLERVSEMRAKAGTP